MPNLPAPTAKPGSGFRDGPRILAALIFLLGAGPARAAELELAGYLGVTLPFYEQTFPIDLRPPERPIQGIEIRQEEPLRLNAKGGLVLAGAATVYFGGAFGIEARYDSADVDIQAEPPLYSLTPVEALPELQHHPRARSHGGDDLLPQPGLPEPEAPDRGPDPLLLLRRGRATCPTSSSR